LTLPSAIFSTICSGLPSSLACSIASCRTFSTSSAGTPSRLAASGRSDVACMANCLPTSSLAGVPVSPSSTPLLPSKCHVAGQRVAGHLAANPTVHRLAQLAVNLGELRLDLPLDALRIRGCLAALRDYLGNLVGQVDEHFVLGHRRGLAAQLDDPAALAVGGDELAHPAFARLAVAAGFHLALVLFGQPLDRAGFVAVALGEGLLALHHRQAGLLPQRHHLRRLQFCHRWLSPPVTGRSAAGITFTKNQSERQKRTEPRPSGSSNKLEHTANRAPRRYLHSH
jgi:hypothetical protein